MSRTESAFSRDANSVPITTIGLQESKLVTFVGGTANGIGDYDGTGNPVTLFSVTGEVLVNVFGLCTTDLAGASATIEVGVAGATAALCNQVTATDVDDHDVYHDSVLAVGGQVAGHFHAVDQDIILTVATANVTGGVIQFYCNWVPLSENGIVVAA